MDTQKQILVEQRLSNEKKSTGVAYLLWIFLAGFGAHRFYLGKTGSAVAQLILIVGGILLSAILVGVPMLIIGGIWILVDAFLILGMVAEDIATKRSRIIAEINLN